MTESQTSTPPQPPADEPPAEDYDGRDGRPFVFVGLCLIALAFVLSWWSLTKYRVPAQRGIHLGIAEQTDLESRHEGEDEAEYQKRMKDYHAEIGLYQHSWDVNLSQYRDYYLAHLGDKYGEDLDSQDKRSLKSGTVYFRGWSTWTGWFGVVGLVLLLGLQIAPKFAPQLDPWAWAFPWAGAAWFGLFTLSAVAFFFTVPDENGDGYSQGVGFGNYLAMVGGALAAAGCIFYGLQTADQRVAFLQSRGESADKEEEDEPEPPPKPAKNRLQDW